MAFFRFLFCFSNVVCECPPNLAIYLFTCLVDLSPGHGVLPAYLSSCLLTYRPIPVYTNLRTYLSTHPKPLHVYHPADLSKEYIYLSTNLLNISAGLLVYFSTLFPTNLTYILYYTCLHFYFIWIYVCLPIRVRIHTSFKSTKLLPVLPCVNISNSNKPVSGCRILLLSLELLYPLVLASNCFLCIKCKTNIKNSHCNGPTLHNEL